MTPFELLPISLLPTPAIGRGAAASDEAFRSVRTSVLDRDGHTCRFCGFSDPGPYMQVHHRDGDHSNQDPGNLATACAHCHAPHHMGLHADRAYLAWIPELSQAEVSALCRAALVARLAPTVRVEGSARDRSDPASLGRHAAGLEVRDFLARRRTRAEEFLGTSDPRVLANCLGHLSDEGTPPTSGAISGIRFVMPGFGGAGGRLPDEASVERWLSPGGPYAAAGW
jgi:intracellular multiplication protein IcmJ